MKNSSRSSVAWKPRQQPFRAAKSRRRRRAGREPRWEELTSANEVADSADDEAALHERERRSRLLDEMEHLNPRQRLAVTLRYFEQMPVREIAEALDCSVGNVKNLLFRSLEKLRRRPAIARLANE